ncbi:gas vesicle protein GvpJ [Pseudonocardia sp. KRD291]|uniref:gas vesicle protein n=1 Tax=Pseudonocardia sp. KRD291 TaxID=2792007 RepID=UPI001C5C5932|nr:gas vesicle protein [Pseudonocardia sp. KRD291]
MSDTVRWNTGQPRRQESAGNDGANLADILERVLDKGIVIAGDIQVNLLDIELLTIKIRLVVASVDRAKEMGIDWWERDPTLSAGRQELEDENDELRSRIAALEAVMARNPELAENVEEDAEEPDAEESDAEEPDAEEPDAEEPDAEEPDAEATDEPGDADEPDGAGQDEAVPAERPAPRRRKSRER